MTHFAARQREFAAPRPETLRLLPDRELDALRRSMACLLEVPPRLEPRLRGAVEATLANPGSLWRAQLAWATASELGLGGHRAEALACSVESFHVASLLFDDLPAMDDAETRRARPCVHRVHGEAAAILAGLAFVQEGHARLASALDESSPTARREALSLASECLGLRGILDGQARDLTCPAGRARLVEAVDRAAAKSVPLLRLALELPAIVAGSGGDCRSALRCAAESLGLAYQLLDDLADRSVVDREGAANASRALGVGATRREIGRQLAAARAAARDLAPSMPGLVPVLAAVVQRFEIAAAAVRA